MSNGNLNTTPHVQRNMVNLTKMNAFKWLIALFPLVLYGVGSIIGLLGEILKEYSFKLILFINPENK